MLLLGAQGAWQCLRCSVRTVISAATSVGSLVRKLAVTTANVKAHHVFNSATFGAGYGAQAVMTHEGPFKVSCFIQESRYAFQHASPAVCS